MKNKKGFTLIELLAVIIILAVIALITVPVVVNMIEKANKSSFKEMANGLLRAGDLYYSRQEANINEMGENVEFIFPNDIKGLEIKGKLPEQGSMEITQEGDIALGISNGRYCIIKDYKDTKITIHEDVEHCYRPGNRPLEGEYQLTFSDGVGRDLTNYIIYGNSVQNGNPTIDTPIEVESVGDYDEATGKYKIPVIVSKDIFKTVTLEQGGMYDSGGNLTESTTRVRTNLFPLEAGTYTFKMNWNTNKSFVKGIHIFNYETEKWEKYTAYASQNVTFTLSEKAKIRIVFNKTTNDKITPEDVLASNPVLQKGETIEEDQITNIYLDEPLRKIGDYADYIDFKNGKVVRRVKEMELTEKQEMYPHNYFTSANGYSIPPAYVRDYLKYSTYGFSNYFIKQNVSSRLTLGIAFGENINIVVPFDMNLSTADDFEQWLGKKYNDGKPVRIYYILATQTEETIDLPAIPTLIGTNVIEVDTKIKPSNIKAIY